MAFLGWDVGVSELHTSSYNACVVTFIDWLLIFKAAEVVCWWCASSRIASQWLP